MVALVRAIHSRFYPLGRQVARFDLQLTYFSKWAELPILVLLTIFDSTVFSIAIFTLRIMRKNLTFSGNFNESLGCVLSALAYYARDFTV